MQLTRLANTGDADRYILTDDEGRTHHIMVSSAQKAVSADGGKAALAKAVARALLKSAGSYV